MRLTKDEFARLKKAVRDCSRSHGWKKRICMRHKITLDALNRLLRGKLTRPPIKRENVYFDEGGICRCGADTSPRAIGRCSWCGHKAFEGKERHIGEKLYCSEACHEQAQTYADDRGKHTENEFKLERSYRSNAFKVGTGAERVAVMEVL